MRKYLFLFFLISLVAYAQENPLEKNFSNLVGKTWKAEGKWGDASVFKQEILFRYSLDKKIIITETKGFTNKEQTIYGNRNHGIRKYDKETNSIRFWEFDVFGGLTKGTVLLEDKNIRYIYQYGDTVVTDMWEYINDTTYKFTVGNYVDGKWKQKYLETEFKLVK